MGQTRDSTQTEDTSGLTETDRHRLLASGRRRAALAVLVESTGPVDLHDLAAAVAEMETDGGEVDDDTVDAVALALHHIHLPKLDDGGVIEYDRERHRVVNNPSSTPL